MEIKNLSFSYKKLKIFNNIDLSVKKGKVTVFLGPSGCGKTTLLNLISGVLKPDSGEIIKDSNSTISYLFQEPRLLPWQSVESNIKFVLDSLVEREKNRRVDHLLEELELKEFKDFLPSKLSGGMRQRVSIARAFAFPSDTILMDEPFKGLDLPLKLNLFRLFNRVWREEERTALFVTHDIQEAIQLGDEIVVLTKKPVIVKQQITNPIPHNKRTLQNPEILSLEKKLYKLII